MKKLTYLFFLSFTLSIFLTSCSEEFMSIDEQQLENQLDKKKRGSRDPGNPGVVPTLDCDNHISGEYSGGGFHVYPKEDMDLSCITPGTIMSITVDALDVPNRFRVIDPNGNFPTLTYTATGSTGSSTGWLGSGNYFGPWGNSINTIPTFRTYTFVANTPGIYQIEIETVAPPANTPQSQTDAWSVSFCACPDTIPPPGDNDCGKSFSGLFNGVGYHNYPPQVFDLTGVLTGRRVCVTVNAVEVPNRFRVLDNSGNIFPLTYLSTGATSSSTGWLGDVNYSGPWGGSISTIPTTRTYSFIKGSSDSYHMDIETVVNSNPYLKRTDEWTFSINCDCFPPVGGGKGGKKGVLSDASGN